MLSEKKKGRLWQGDPKKNLHKRQCYPPKQRKSSQKCSNRITLRRSDMPQQYRKLYDRVMSGKASPRQAIKMHCLECWGYVRTETQNCADYACPLRAYRPYQKPVKSPTKPVQQSNINELRQGGQSCL